MRKAVVPVKDTFVHHGIEIATLGVGGNLMVDSFKLTKEDIETLVRVYEEFRSDIWKDKSECMVLAVKSIGIEVED